MTWLYGLLALVLIYCAAQTLPPEDDPPFWPEVLLCLLLCAGALAAAVAMVMSTGRTIS